MQQEQFEEQDAELHKRLQVKSFRSKTDVLGSYTGTPFEGDDVPEQDADDL